MKSRLNSCLLVIVGLLLTYHTNFTSAQGVCYGLLGNNLPSTKNAAALCNSNHIQHIRLYEPVPEVLQELQGWLFSVSLGMRNEDIQGVAADPAAATSWVNTYVTPYTDKISFKYIIVGNEAVPGPYAQWIAKAMENVQIALSNAGLGDQIKVTTAVSSQVLGLSYPPSEGVFSEETVGPMRDIATLLRRFNTGLMITVYPYFAYASDPDHVSLDYALFRATESPVVDKDLNYFNLFDAMVDSFIAALEKIDFGDIGIVVAETGWPTAGNPPFASIENAQAYNNNLMRHIKEAGTPKRPNQRLEMYFFALFNENLKEAGVEQNFGFFYPDMSPVYPFNWG